MTGRDQPTGAAGPGGPDDERHETWIVDRVDDGVVVLGLEDEDGAWVVSEVSSELFVISPEPGDVLEVPLEGC